jgi:hypothetical protein
VHGGSSGSSAADDTTMATRAAVEKEAVDATTAKKFMDDAAVMKKAAVDVASVKKAANEAVNKKNATAEVAATKKAADDAATVGSGSSFALSAGAKRVSTPSGSTPLAKQRFLRSWKPWYVAQTFICQFLYRICDFDLVFLVYNVPSSGRSPSSGGPVL